MSVGRKEIEAVAYALGSLKERCFLTGGASIPFYVTDDFEELPRVTVNIDVAIEITSAKEFRSGIERQLRSRGFANDASEGAPICRWKLGAITVDIMPTEESILGFTNPWYRDGLNSLMPIHVSDTCDWRVLAPPFELASKCAAFSDRGKTDPGASSDLEDIVTLVNGRSGLPAEIVAADPKCKTYLSSWFLEQLRDPTIRDVLPYHLPPHPSGQARLPIVLKRMNLISEMQ